MLTSAGLLTLHRGLLFLNLLVYRVPGGGHIGVHAGFHLVDIGYHRRIVGIFMRVLFIIARDCIVQVFYLALRVGDVFLRPCDILVFLSVLSVLARLVNGCRFLELGESLILIAKLFLLRGEFFLFVLDILMQLFHPLQVDCYDLGVSLQGLLVGFLFHHD